MMDYKKISRNIRVVYAVLLTLVVVLIVLCEFHLLPVEGMLLGMSPGTKYIVEVSMLFGVGVGILAALKGFNWCLHHKVHAKEGEQRTALYVMLNNVRFCLLAFLMLLGVFFYYGTLENWGMYYGLAAFVASLFCLPSSEGVEIELAVDKTL